MSVEKTFILRADVKEALKKIDDLNEKVEGLSESAKKTEKNTKSMSGSFKAMGIAKITAGVGLLTKFFGSLWEQMQKNQAVADTVNTAFNSIGVAFKLVTDAIVNTINAVKESSENFDALGRIAKNVLDLALTPIKLGFQAIKLGIQSTMLAWEKSVFGGKDADKIEKLTTDIQDTKESIKDVGKEAIQSGKEIVSDFKEGVDEVKNIGKTTVDSFKEVFEGVTIASIIEQGKAITETKKNYGLLALEQQRLIEQYDREAEVLRQQRDDIRLTVDERIAANDKLAGVLEKQTEAEKQAIQEQINAVTQLNELEGETPERMEELFALKTEMIAIDAKIAGLTSEQKTNEAALQDERISNIQELSSIGKTQLEQQMEDIDIEAENRRILAERTISDEQQLQDMLVNIDKDAADKKLAIEKALAASRRNIVGTSMGQIASLIGEETKAGKALAIGQALINTYSAAAAALAPPPVGAGPIFGPIAAAGAIAAGMAQVKQIIATKLPGGDGGGSAGGGSAPPTPTQGIGPMVPNMEAVEPAQGGEGGDSAVQAYVVEQDISNAQALQQELDTQATL
tara:strand:+ start:148 stop:1860 length:1713 start_codon:yes stop_codon:yes gene_type:complete